MFVVVYPTVEVVVEDQHSIAEDETLASRVQGNFTAPIGMEENDWKEVATSILLTWYVRVTVVMCNKHSRTCQLFECHHNASRSEDIKDSVHASGEQLMAVSETTSFK